MSDTPIQARVRSTKHAAHGYFLTDETLKTERQWSWTPEARQLVRELLDAVPHDLDANWTPGSVYILVHRDAQVILDIEAGYIGCYVDRAPDAAAFLRERTPAGSIYQQPAEAARGTDLWCFTLPGANGRMLGGGTLARSSGAVEAEVCDRCFTAKSVTGACLC
jgi:hypothetical protein